MPSITTCDIRLENDKVFLMIETDAPMRGVRFFARTVMGDVERTFVADTLKFSRQLNLSALNAGVIVQFQDGQEDSYATSGLARSGFAA